LIEIGSKTAEKNSAQTNKQTDKPTDTTETLHCKHSKINNTTASVTVAQTTQTATLLM